MVGVAGTGADEHDLLGVADAIDPRFAVASLRAPLSIGAGYRWFEGMSVAPEERAIQQSIGASSYLVTLTPWPFILRPITRGSSRAEGQAVVYRKQQIIEWLRRVPEELGVDVRRVYLFGFSQGATISFTTLASKWPVTGLVAGAVLVSGRLLPHLFSEECVSLHTRLASPEQVRCSCAVVACGNTLAPGSHASGRPARGGLTRSPCVGACA